MRRLLQSIIYNRKLYDRPQDEWTCGRAAEGCPCIFGPGKKGECRATGQCVPAKKGDRWVCTRAISLGAACDPGPQPDGSCGCPVAPCHPQRSLRAQRGRLTWLLSTFALGLVLLVLWGQSSAEWSSPGPLTAQHAMSTQRCADCHLTETKIPLNAAERAAHLHQNDELCLKCHDLGANGESPHGATAAALIALARTPPAGGARPQLAMLTAARGLGHPAELACATCHHEHQGHSFDLKQMADQQCQVCHQAAFTGFAAGHPEFTGYPYTRRTRLEFDHTAHFQKHFSDPRAPAPGPTSCLQCHEPAQNGRQMLVKNFEQTCASCHASQIEGESRAGAKGLVFLRLPGFDLAALKTAGAPIGEWPAFCDGDLTPFMRWMLEGDESARAALATLGTQTPSDLAKATPAQKAAAAQLLWGVKGLLADLVTHGQQVIMRRLGQPGAAPAPRNTGQFSADVALAAQRAWLPNLLTEVAAHRRGETVPSVTSTGKAATGATVSAAPIAKPADPDDLLSDPAPEAAATAATKASAPTAPATLELDSAEDRVATGGWYRSDETYTINYRPGGHADSFLTAWIEGTAANPAPAAQAIFAQLSNDHAPGVCMKCHTVDGAGGAVTVNWHAARPAPEQRPFTTFKHDAHFSLMGAQGCSTCHTLNAEANYAGAFGASRTPAVFHSNFAPMSKNICAACHQPAKAGDNCLECHNYHTGETQNLRLPAGEFHAAPAAGKRARSD